jgi:hypothetical protein
VTVKTVIRGIEFPACEPLCMRRFSV